MSGSKLTVGGRSPNVELVLTSDGVKEPTGEPQAAPPDSSPFAVVARGLQTTLRLEAPNSFAGLVRASDGGIDLYVTVADPALVRTVEEIQASAASAISVRIIPGMKNSLITLEAVRDQINARHSAMAARGVHITELGVGILANRVRIGVKGLTDEIREQLVAQFGADQVEVYEGQLWIARSDRP